MKRFTLAMAGLFFILGGVLGMLINEVFNNITDLASPTVQSQKILEKTLPSDIRFSDVRQKASPQDRIKESQIHVYDNRVVIDIPNMEWATYTDTLSMDPVLDQGANGLEIIPKSPAELEVGDIVAYESAYVHGIIVHRIIKIGTDNQGWYAITRGDNNDSPDPGKIRFEQVKRVLAAVIY